MKEVTTKLRRAICSQLLTNPNTEHQAQTLSKVKNKEVVAGGDGRCPGHSVKYRTYSIVDTDIKGSRTFISSSDRGQKLKWDGIGRTEALAIAKLATDRHIQVRAHLKKEQPNIRHMAKLVKKIEQKGPGKAMRCSQTMDLCHHNSPLVVCKDFTRQWY